METRRRGPKTALNSTLVLCCLCALSLLVTVVAEKDATTEEEEATEEAPELLIDNEIDGLDDPHRNRNYVFGRVVEALVGFTSNAVKGNVDVSRMLYGGNSSSNLYGDNSLWEGLFRDCGQAKPTLTCVKKSVFSFLDRSIGMDGDVEVTNGLVFTKKRGFEEVFENKYDRRLNQETEGVTTEENMEVTTTPSMEKDSARSYSSFDELTNTLYDKGEKFIMTHDLELQLPEFLFESAVLKISPKALQEEGGALLKVELNKKTDTGEGRFLFKKHKKKLMMAFFALMMVIKMIKVKLMFLLPLLLGVGTAKKIFLKLLLFIFPAFAHIFKFCAYYHATRAKFHHHHHQIAHHHHHVPVHVPVPVVTNHNHGSVVIDHPPAPQHPHQSYSSISDSYGPPLNSYGEPTDSYGSPDPPSGGGWDSEFISSRNENLPPTVNELESWGLMSTNGAYHVPPSAQYPLMYDEQRPARNAYEVGVHPQQSPLIQQQQQQLLLMQQQQQKQAQLAMLQQQKLQQQLQPLQHSQGISPQQQKVMQAVTSGGPTAALVQAKQRLKQQQQLAALKMKSLTPRPPIEKVAITVPVTYDPFYSPILQRMDNVFVQLGFNEEACRERLVCSMYKMPERFSPHSNLVSAELSRDSRELQKPSVPNSASVRFHRYIQAARDGQNRKDCLKLYPACTVKTE